MTRSRGFASSSFILFQLQTNPQNRPIIPFLLQQVQYRQLGTKMLSKIFSLLLQETTPVSKMKRQNESPRANPLHRRKASPIDNQLPIVESWLKVVIYQSPYKLILMGTQESCCADTTPPGTEELQLSKSELMLHRAGKFLPTPPFPIAEPALTAYQQLHRQFNSKYLDVSPLADKTGVEELDGYYKLNNLDACYQGEWKNGQPHGRGLATLANGSLLVGSFSQGACSGDHNYFFFKDGSLYVGDIIANRISGNGKLTTPAVTYEGEWHDNLPHGRGMETFASGDRFIGSFEKGVKQGEDCTFIWANHETYLEYKGSFWGGRIKGEGKLTLRDKTSLEGHFEGSNIQRLTFISPKVKFTGNFEMGKPAGKGVLQLTQSNQTFNGNFREGKLYGPCLATDAKGRQTDIFFFEGKQFKQLTNLPDEEARRIAKTVEAAYTTSSKHSDALVEICQQLEDDYECRFVEPFENLFKFNSYVALNVYDKVLLVRSKKS